MLDVNIKTAISLFVLGSVIILVSIPLYLEKIRMNPVYGIRIRKAFESEELWYKINKYGAGALMYWAIILMILGIVCLYVPAQLVLFFAKIGLISIIIPIMQILRYAKRL